MQSIFGLNNEIAPLFGRRRITRRLTNHSDINLTRQESLFPELAVQSIYRKPVNVASIPQRSPFRYPGGKTWFVPTFRDWLSQQSTKPAILVEPFAGGGIISLTALFENLVDTVVMVELDEEIAAVWQTIIDGNAQWLAQRIVNFDLTRETLVYELSKTDSDPRERAFQTILKNRTSHGGILANGSGLLKHGENGKGIRSRWYPQTLAKRFSAIDHIADRITFRQCDGLAVMKEFSNRKDVLFFSIRHIPLGERKRANGYIAILKSITNSCSNSVSL